MVTQSNAAARIKEPRDSPMSGDMERQNSGVRSTPRASAREDLRRNFCAAANFKYQRGYRSRNSGVRSQESGVAEYASKVFIRKSRTSISLGKSSPSSQIL